MSFDVVLKRLPGSPRLLEDVLGMERAQAEAAASRLPAVVIARTTRAHAEIAAGLLRDAGASVDIVAHGAPAEAAPKPRRAAIREVVEERVNLDAKPRRPGPGIREVAEERPARHRDAAEARGPARGSVREEERPRGSLREEERPRGVAREEERPRGSLREEERPRAAREEERPRGSIREVVEDRAPRYRDAAERRTPPDQRPVPERRTPADQPPVVLEYRHPPERRTPPEQKPVAERRSIPERRTPADRPPAGRSELDGDSPAPARAPTEPMMTPTAPAPSPLPMTGIFAPEPAPLAQAATAPAPAPRGPVPTTKLPRATPHEGAGFLAAKPLIDFPDEGGASADPLASAATGTDKAFGPLDFESTVVLKPGAPAPGLGDAPPSKARTSEPEDEVESLFRAPPTAFGARKKAQVDAGYESVERDARTRLERGERAPERPRDAGGKRAPAQAAALDVPMIAPKRRSPWVARVAAALATFTVAMVIAAMLEDRGAEAHAGTALGDGTRPSAPMHPLVRLAPRGIDRSMGSILRKLVDGTTTVHIDTEGMPPDTQCLLVRADDGKRQARMDKLLRTGLSLPLSEEQRAEFAEQEESMRNALGDSSLKWGNVCLSVDAWAEKVQKGE